jgi:hypothetical protein
VRHTDTHGIARRLLRRFAVRRNGTAWQRRNLNESRLFLHLLLTESRPFYAQVQEEEEPEEDAEAEVEADKKKGGQFLFASGELPLTRVREALIGIPLINHPQQDQRQRRLHHTITQHNTTKHNTTQHNTTQHNKTHAFLRNVFSWLSRACLGKLIVLF